MQFFSITTFKMFQKFVDCHQPEEIIVAQKTCL